jgi:hypothetical protein
MKLTNADVVLRLMLFTFAAFGLARWLTGWCSQMEIRSRVRARLLMAGVFALNAAGALAGFGSFLSVVAVVYGEWKWPWYVGFLAGGAQVYGIFMVQWPAMTAFHEWDNRVSAKNSERSREGPCALYEVRESAETPSSVRQWINAGDIKYGPIRHETLGEEDMARLHQLHARLHPIDGWSFDYRLDFFKRDLDPGREIRICERIADICDRAYDRFGPFTQEQRREIWGLLCGGLGSPTDEFLKRNPPKRITLSQAQQIFALHQ